MTAATHAGPRPRWLLLSAAALAALLIVQAGRWLGPAAQAEMVSSSGNYTILTADAGTEDVLLVLDGRKELLMVYRVENQATLELYNRYELPRLFQDARGRAPGRK